MRFPGPVSFLAAAIIALAIVPGDAQQQEQPGLKPGATAAKPAMLNQYCITCHNQRLKTAGLLLDSMDVEHVEKDAAAWEKVIRKVRTGMMPPSGARRPDRAALDAFAADLEGRLDRAAILAASLDAPSLHRLNRTEYANAVRDLLALDVDVATLLPADASSEGF